jgi:hypothetical protein
MLSLILAGHNHAAIGAVFIPYADDSRRLTLGAAPGGGLKPRDFCFMPLRVSGRRRNCPQQVSPYDQR